MTYSQSIIIKFGGGTYMIRLKRISAGILVVALIVGASIVGQLFTSAHAANTLANTSSQIVTIGGTTDGLPVNASAIADGFSGDGNVILFSSSATNLPNASTYGGLYTYNISTNTVTRVDVSTSGVQPNANLWNVYKMSETGRYILFGSNATNLIDGATKAANQYYIRDTKAGTTTYVPNHFSGVVQNMDRQLSISNDGRFILVASRYWANNYPYNYGAVLGENVSGTMNWTMLGLGSGGENSANSTAVVGGLSCDGMFATYQGYSSVNLVDIRRGTTTTVTAGNAGTSPIISCNGRYVLYATTNRTDITPTPSGMDSYLHLVRYDRITGERMYIDSDSSNVFSTSHLQWNAINEPPANIFSASVADTGDVVFNYNGYTYLKHLSDGSGTLESIGRTTSGTYVNTLANARLTSDGRYIFFYTDPYNLGLAGSPSGNQLIRTKTNI